MIGPERLLLFSLVSSIAYTLAYYFDWALFRYYPIANEVRWLSPAVAGATPMSWYGWIATALLVGVTVASLIPRTLARRIPADTAWLIWLLLLAATLLYEKRWFI